MLRLVANAVAVALIALFAVDLLLIANGSERAPVGVVAFGLGLAFWWFALRPANRGKA